MNLPTQVYVIIAFYYIFQDSESIIIHKRNIEINNYFTTWQIFSICFNIDKLRILCVRQYTACNFQSCVEF